MLPEVLGAMLSGMSRLRASLSIFSDGLDQGCAGCKTSNALCVANNAVPGRAVLAINVRLAAHFASGLFIAISQMKSLARDVRSKKFGVSRFVERSGGKRQDCLGGGVLPRREVISDVQAGAHRLVERRWISEQIIELWG